VRHEETNKENPLTTSQHKNKSTPLIFKLYTGLVILVVVVCIIYIYYIYVHKEKHAVY
jgi:hypothetical protein